MAYSRVCLYCFKRRPVGDKNSRFHKFPINDKETLKKWRDFCNLHEKDIISNTHALCGYHFTPNDYINFEQAMIPGARLRLKPGAVPSIRKKMKHCEMRVRSDLVETSTVKSVEHTSKENLKLKSGGNSTVQKKAKHVQNIPPFREIAVQTEMSFPVIFNNTGETGTKHCVQPRVVSEIKLEHFYEPRMSKIVFRMMTDNIDKLRKKVKAAQTEKSKMQRKIKALTELVEYLQQRRGAATQS